MNSYNYHMRCHYNDLISFIDDLKSEFGESNVLNILENHYQLDNDILDFELAVMESNNYEN